jgi:RNA polymerase sigma-70 factor (ECF subfamily)
MRAEEDGPDFSETIAAPDKLEHGLDEADRRRLLEAALRKLPGSQRVPLVLFHFEELAYDEIAQRLGISLSKVKTDIHRARLALKRYLRPSLVGEDRPDPGLNPPGANHSN